MLLAKSNRQNAGRNSDIALQLMLQKLGKVLAMSASYLHVPYGGGLGMCLCISYSLPFYCEVHTDSCLVHTATCKCTNNPIFA